MQRLRAFTGRWAIVARDTIELREKENGNQRNQPTRPSDLASYPAWPYALEVNYGEGETNRGPNREAMLC